MSHKIAHYKALVCSTLSLDNSSLVCSLEHILGILCHTILILGPARSKKQMQPTGSQSHDEDRWIIKDYPIKARLP